ALLDRETAQLLAARYRRLAELVVADPDASLETLELAATDERRLLDAWQSGADAAATLPVESPASVLAKAVTRLDGLFAAAADAQPDAVAIQSDGTWLTYRQADSRANQIARWLAERGVAAGSPVGCCVRRGADAWLAHLACLKAGAVYVPLDDAGPTARLANLLRDCGAAVLLSDTETAVSLGLAAAELPARLELIDESADEIALQDTAPPSHAATADEAAYVIYTSGSTGEPKGVAVSHAAMLHHLRRVLPVYGVAEADRVLQFSAMTFDPSLEQAWSAWSAGAALVVRGPRLWSPSEFWTQAAGQGVTVANLPPAYFREVTAAKKALAEQPAALRLVIVGGDAFPQDTLAAWRGSGTRLLNAYGPTEAVVTSTVADVTDFDPASGRAPIGRPLPGTRAYVVNEHGRPAPVGVPGELLLASDALALGYLNDAERTGSRFAPAAGLTGDDRPVYRTGDRARWNHRGQLELLGRIDRQVKVNGYRVELGEVEQAILATPGVCGAVAKLQTAGDGVELVAYYTTSGKTDGVDPATLTAALRRRLPHYMTPSAMALLDDLPRNPSGKVAIDALPPLAADRVASAAAYAGPQNELQRVLTEVWSDVLGVERVGIHDDFFELGGASLKSLQIVSAAEARGLRLPNEAMSPALLFEYPTIAQLATLLTIGGAPAAAAPAG
ncbi:MAG: non-ribosomal peptide synthetase, partial [Planctomycetota bacterium]